MKLLIEQKLFFSFLMNELDNDILLIKLKIVIIIDASQRIRILFKHRRLKRIEHHRLLK